jgi:gliding motility-associated-like protein
MKKQLPLIVLKFIVFLLLILLNEYVGSQNVVNNGACIVIKEGDLIIGENYFNRNDGAFDGKIDLDGTIILKQNWFNYANNEVLISAGTGPVGKVIMDGTFRQYIEGTHPTLFENLILRNSDKKLGISNCKVNDTLVLDAVLDLNAHRIKLLNGGPSALKYESNYILSETNSAEGLGEMEWYIGQNSDTYVVPFGSGNDVDPDLSVTLITQRMSNSSDGSVSFATYPTDCDNIPFPAGVDQLDHSYAFVADRYWIIDPLYDKKPGVDIILQYLPKDVDENCNWGLKEAEMQAIRYNTIIHSWNDMSPRGYSDPNAHRFYIEDVSPEDFYAPWCLVSEPLDWELFFPNAFTPNGDGVNEYFSPIGDNLDKLDLKMYIYDRWGKLVYVMEDISKPWDGKTGKPGIICPEGIYTWILFLKDANGMELDYKGIVTLIN